MELARDDDIDRTSADYWREQWRCMKKERDDERRLREVYGEEITRLRRLVSSITREGASDT